jgi:hypothetical protein
VFGVVKGKLMHWKVPKSGKFVWSSCRGDYLHSIATMMGFHAVKLWQNETFHCRNQMNIIILITNGKDGSRLWCQVFVEAL